MISIDPIRAAVVPYALAIKVGLVSRRAQERHMCEVGSWD